MKQKAFTLAEILIALSVIAILSAILFPSIQNAMVNKNVVKFQKAHEVLNNAISELVNSDYYYLDGDLSTKVDGTLVDGTHEGDYTYFCKSLAGILNVKSANCVENGYENTYIAASHTTFEAVTYSDSIDVWCKETHKNICPKISNFSAIKLEDNVYFYEVNPKAPFGVRKNGCILYKDKGRYDFLMQQYKGFCLDFDGLCKGVEPLGYGVNVYGKIQPYKKAQEWLNKSIQDKD